MENITCTSEQSKSVTTEVILLATAALLLLYGFNEALQIPTSFLLFRNEKVDLEFTRS